MQFKAQDRELVKQARYDIYSFKTSLFEAYKKKGKNKVLIPIFKQYQREMLTIIIPNIKDEYLDYLIENNISSVYIAFSGVRVTRFVNIFLNYDFPENIAHPRLEQHEESILSRLIELDKFIMSKNINESYKEDIKLYRTIFIEFKDPYHKKLVIDNLLTVDDKGGIIDPDYFIKTYPEILEISTKIQVSVEGNFFKPYNGDEFIGLTLECPRELIFDSLEVLDNAIHGSSSLPKLNIPLIVSFDSDDQADDKSTLEVKLSKTKKKDNIQLDTIEKIVDNITIFNTKQIIRIFNEKYKIVPHDIEVAAVKQEPTGLDLLKEFYLYDNQLKTLFETHLPEAKWNGKYDEESIKPIDTISALSNLVRFCSVDKFKPNLLFGMVDGLKFINRSLLEKYLSEHYSKEDLYSLIKVRCTNPAVKELDICYYYSDYFKDTFKYFDIDYMHAYPSFIRFMINFIMQEEIVE